MLFTETRFRVPALAKLPICTAEVEEIAANFWTLWGAFDSAKNRKRQHQSS